MHAKTAVTTAAETWLEKKKTKKRENNPSRLRLARRPSNIFTMKRSSFFSILHGSSGLLLRTILLPSYQGTCARGVLVDRVMPQPARYSHANSFACIRSPTSCCLVDERAVFLRALGTTRECPRRPRHEYDHPHALWLTIMALKQLHS